MNKTGKAILYISASIILLGGALALLLKKPKGDDEPNAEDNPNTPPENGGEVPQSTPTSINGILRLPTASSQLKGKSIFAKVSGAKGRTEPFVNDGYISNENFIKYSTKGAIGTATGVIKEDQGKTKSPQGYVLKWVEISISQAAADEFNRNAPWYVASNKKAGQKTLMREDVIKL